jgi:hypothetical protein
VRDAETTLSRMAIHRIEHAAMGDDQNTAPACRSIRLRRNPPPCARIAKAFASGKLELGSRDLNAFQAPADGQRLFAGNPEHSQMSLTQSGREMVFRIRGDAVLNARMRSLE